MDEKILAFKTITGRNNKSREVLQRKLQQQKQKDMNFNKKIIKIIYGN